MHCRCISSTFLEPWSATLSCKTKRRVPDSPRLPARPTARTAVSCFCRAYRGLGLNAYERVNQQRDMHKERRAGNRCN
jgi:hypothetical protein